MCVRLGTLTIASFLLVGLAHPALGVNVLMLTDSNGVLSSSESTLKSRLEQAGFRVNTLWDGDSQANYTAAFADNDCVYVPQSVTSTDVNTKLRSAPIGVVNEEVLLMDDLGLCSSNGTTTSGNSLSI